MGSVPGPKSCSSGAYDRITCAAHKSLSERPKSQKIIFSGGVTAPSPHPTPGGEGASSFAHVTPSDDVATHLGPHSCKILAQRLDLAFLHQFLSFWNKTEVFRIQSRTAIRWLWNLLRHESLLRNVLEKGCTWQIHCSGRKHSQVMSNDV